MKILIKNVYTGENYNSKYDIYIDKGLIQNIVPSDTAKQEQSGFDRVIDGDGLTAFSGLVDMHCHLREPGQEYKENILSGSMAAARGGFTTVACMPNILPPADNPAVIRYIYEKAEQAGYVNVLPIACITKGQKGQELTEFGFLKEAGAAALSDDGLPVENSLIMKNALLYAKSHGMLIISHCEDPKLSAEGSVNEGYNSTLSGLKGISAAAEEVMVARDIILAEHTNMKIHIAHVSTKGSVNLIKDAKKRGVKVTCETCPHYFAGDDSMILDYDTNAKVNPPLRSGEDRQAIVRGIKEGIIDVIATDHAPHHKDDKNKEFDIAASGISGFETAFALSYTHLVKANHITFERLIELMSHNPAKILGLSRGGIEKGAPADIAIADLNANYNIDVSTFLSKGKNNPFNGANVFGKILHTIKGGEIKILNGEAYAK